MSRWVGSVALVTGASAGIGKAISEKLVEAGVKVIGVARSKDKLDELAKNLSSKQGKFYAFRGDVSKEEDILASFKWAKENVGSISILINNAGVAPYLSFMETPTKEWTNILNINVLAATIGAREAIKQMDESRIDGHIININSIAGQRILGQIPNLHMYQASKYALTAMSETLRINLAQLGSKIKITNINPGMVNTDMVRPSIEHMRKMNKEAQIERPMLEADDIAEAVLYALSTPKHVQIPQLTIQAVGEP
ncbi:unnamed protein product [Psylliodes chrysocephalus]|uniref:Farnesol dehydrogenase-like n=1 Tax=Psylliodes chrysocephalus TaxID=3402493 RepID=A0A9P0D275_9CUCU|nr:unnamed protein product [Psylliodes chrysocephala]